VNVTSAFAHFIFTHLHSDSQELRSAPHSFAAAKWTNKRPFE